MRYRKEKDDIEEIIQSEEKRQEESIDLIASENYTPPRIQAAVGSVLMQKYAEGYPGRRYYPGTEKYDAIEEKAKQRALELFGLSAKQWHVNVQAYSGAIANMEIYLAFLKPKDTILSLELPSGGHLSHGAKVSFTGKLFRVQQYGVTSSYDIDYGELEAKAKKFKPKLIVSGASAIPKKIQFKKIGTIAKKIHALHLADISHYAGLISAKAYPSPFPHADIVMTTTHKSLFGPRGALIFTKKDLAEKLDKAVFPGMQGGPHMHTIAGIAMGLKFAKEHTDYFKQVVRNAKAIAQALKKRGYTILGGSPEAHMVLVNVSKKGLDGLQAERKLEQCGIYANRNAVRSDMSVQKTSAIRIGTYASTYRLMREKDMEQIALLIDEALQSKKPAAQIKKEVRALCKKYPINHGD